HCDDCVRRWPDLGADVGQELALGPGSFLGSLSGRFQVARIHSQSIFCLPALDELTDLAANRAHHLQQLAIRLLDLVAEEFEHTEDLSPEKDRKTECCMQTFLSRDRRTWKVQIKGHIFYPGRSGLRPDSARQAYAWSERLGVSPPVEFLNLR